MLALKYWGFTYKRWPMNEEHNLIDILISVFLKQETYFSPECRSNVLIIENLGNTEKYNEKENIIHH